MQVKQLFLNLFMFIVGSFNFLRNHVQYAIDVVQLIKATVNSKELDVLTGLTKFEWDDKLLKKVRKALDTAITGLQILECSNKDGLEAKLACLIEVLRTCPEWYKDKVYLEISSKIVQETHDNKISKVDAETLVQLWYKRLKDKQELL